MIKAHILIIDDDPVVVFLMKRLTQKTELSSNPLTFQSAISALREFRKMYNTNSDFTLFLDINMPEMSGWEFLNELNAFADPSNTQVYIITSSTDQADAERADRNKFVRKLLVKPILKENLLEINSQVRRSAEI